MSHPTLDSRNYEYEECYECDAILYTAVKYCPYCGMNQQDEDEELASVPPVTSFENNISTINHSDKVPDPVPVPVVAIASVVPAKVDSPSTGTITPGKDADKSNSYAYTNTPPINTHAAQTKHVNTLATPERESQKSLILANLSNQLSLKKKNTWLKLKDLALLILFCFFLSDINGFLRKTTTPLILNEIRVIEMDGMLVYEPLYLALRAITNPPPKKKRRTR